MPNYENQVYHEVEKLAHAEMGLKSDCCGKQAEPRVEKRYIVMTEGLYEYEPHRFDKPSLTMFVKSNHGRCPMSWNDAAKLAEDIVRERGCKAYVLEVVQYAEPAKAPVRWSNF